MRFFLTINLVLISFFCSSQICNFCDYRTVKDVLKEEGLRYVENIETYGEQKLTVSEKPYQKIWYFRYGRCYLYEIVVYRRSHFRSMMKVLNRQYRRKNRNLWEDMQNKVVLYPKKGNSSFCFYPKNLTR